MPPYTTYYNEAETRYQLIDPILRDKGYREWRINPAHYLWV